TPCACARGNNDNNDNDNDDTTDYFTPCACACARGNNYMSSKGHWAAWSTSIQFLIGMWSQERWKVGRM
ncbi:MAG: hypothetical protein MJE68_32930, partial [Proteobacteria bacterium]|nr:hypothetical protein [Pseudomonadota bacterium]